MISLKLLLVKCPESLTPKEFKKILHSHPTAKFMRQRELDVMFRMFDTDRDGVLEETEFQRKNRKDKKKEHRERDDEVPDNARDL